MVAFSLQWIALDFALRGVAPYRKDPRLLLTALASIFLGIFVAGLASRKIARVAISLFGAVTMVVDVIVFRHYRVPLDEQVIETARAAWSDVRPMVVAMLPGALPIIAAVAALEYGLLTLASRRARSGAIALAVGLMALAAGGKLREGTLEVRLAHAATLAWEPDRPPPATAVHVPSLTSRRARLPNVLFILTESVRADDYDAATAPRAHQLLRSQESIEFPHMRSIASYTAVSVSALLTGRTQLGARSESLATPTWFDWIKSTHAEGTGAMRRQVDGLFEPKVLYWSGQSERVIERPDLHGMLDSFVTMETLLGQAVGDEDELIDRGVDRLLAAHVEESLPSLRTPYFITLHFGGTHAPYFVDKDDAPFRPWERTVTWSHMPLLHEAYRNAIYEQDKSVARAISAFLRSAGDAPWIIFFTSDHGESFGERGAIHHGQNLYDEQTHVPGWMAFGNGALEPEEIASLKKHAANVVTHLDLLPTLLDAYGVLDTAAMISPPRASLGGQSLLRTDEGKRPPLPITNCTEMFPCPVNTWGMLDDERLLVAQPWDSAFHCMDAKSGEEMGNADDTACRSLTEASKSYFRELPNGAANL